MSSPKQLLVVFVVVTLFESTTSIKFSKQCEASDECAACARNVTCVAPAYDVCSCDQTTLGLEPRPLVCLSITDRYENRICGYDVTQQRCFGCNSFTSKIDCANQQNCQWQSAMCGPSNFTLPTNRKGPDSQSCDPSACKCDASVAFPLNRTVVSELATNFPTRFTTTTCGTSSYKHCPNGIGYVSIKCGPNGQWRGWSWDSSKCVNYNIYKAGNVLPRSPPKRNQECTPTDPAEYDALITDLLAEAKVMSESTSKFWYLGSLDVAYIQAWMTESVAMRLQSASMQAGVAITNSTKGEELVDELGCIIANIQTLCTYRPGLCTKPKGPNYVYFSVLLNISQNPSVDEIHTDFTQALTKWMKSENLGDVEWVTTHSHESTANLQELLGRRFAGGESLTVMVAAGTVPKTENVQNVQELINAELNNNLATVIRLFDARRSELPMFAQTQLMMKLLGRRVKVQRLSQVLEFVFPAIASLLVPTDESVYFTSKSLRIHSSSLSCPKEGDHESLVVEDDNLVLSAGETYSNDRRRSDATLDFCGSSSDAMVSALNSIGFGVEVDSSERSKQKAGVSGGGIGWRDQISVSKKELRRLRCAALKKSSGCDATPNFGVSFTVHEGDSLFPQDEILVMHGNETWMPLIGSKANNTYVPVVTRILSVSMGIENETLQVPIQLEFEGSEVDTAADGFSVPKCAYYSFDDKAWRTDGGNLSAIPSDSDDALYGCTFNHTTNFAVLLDVGQYYSNNDDDDDDDVMRNATNSWSDSDTEFDDALRVITYVGMAVSAVAYVSVIVTFTFFSKLRTTARWILCNMCGALLIGEVVFVATLLHLATNDDRISSHACTSLGAIAHYALLVAFCWMLVDAVYIHTSFTSVYSAYTRDEKMFFRRCLFVAYGVPLIITGATFAKTTPYGGDGHCFLSGDAIWAFAGPVLVVIFVNFVFFVRIVRVVYSSAVQSDSNYTRSDKDILRREKQIRLKRSLRASASFFFLMGLGWLFGFFAHGELAKAFQAIFSISLVLQGICIFYFHCFVDTEVRKSWSKALSSLGSSSNDASNSNPKLRVIRRTLSRAPDDCNHQETVWADSTDEDKTSLNSDSSLRSRASAHEMTARSESIVSSARGGSIVSSDEHQTEQTGIGTFMSI